MTDDHRAIQVTDSRVLAAMAHPLRQRLLDVLYVDGPATASMLALSTDQAVGNVSHHLRVLGTAGLIEEAPELARDRRERWWRRVTAEIRWSAGDFEDSPTAEVISRAASSLNFEHHVDQVRRSMAAEPAGRTGSFSTDHWLTLTDSELAELGEEVIALFQRWSAQPTPDDGLQRHTVFAFAVGVPGRP